jgi:hypothetical protein
MKGSHLLPAGLSKEIRALAPLWLGCAAIVWAGGLGDPFLFRAGFLSYLVGSAALGALSIGHEYTNRTLPLSGGRTVFIIGQQQWCEGSLDSRANRPIALDADPAAW